MNKKIVLQSNRTISKQTSPQEIQSILLQNRNIKDVDKFLYPQKPTADPSSFSINPDQFSDFINHLKSQLKLNKKVLIYGDYDADGVTSTALLYSALFKHSKNIIPFTPHREQDGYGIKYQSVLNFIKKKSFKPDLILTIDNGISAKNEVQKLIDEGYEVMVIDHHISGSTAPNIKHILHSIATSAAGLAWLVSCQFEDNPQTELAAIGIIADCLELKDINRQLVVEGLRQLKITKNFGLQSVLRSSNLVDKDLTVYDVAFKIAPRINASGRLDDPTDSLRLLCAPNQNIAEKYCQILNNFNQDRQEIQKENLEKVETSLDMSRKVFIVRDDSIHPGVIGLIAGKLTEKYYKPSIVLTSVDGVLKGSCRSIPEFHITDALETQRHLCIDMGGHALAAGLSILPENLAEFTKKLTSYATSNLKDVELVPKILVDAKAETEAVTLENIKSISALSPFGFGNPEPLFLFENIKIKLKNILGSTGNHLKFLLDNNLEAVLFSASEKNMQISVGDSISFIAKMDSNTWNNQTKPQLVIKYII